MPTSLVITMLVIGGLTYVPSCRLRNIADRTINWHKEEPYRTTGVNYVQEDALARKARPWQVVRPLLDVYVSAVTLVFGIPTLLAKLAFRIVSDSYDGTAEREPELIRLLGPFLPFLGVPMFVVACYISMFTGSEKTHQPSRSKLRSVS